MRGEEEAPDCDRGGPGTAAGAPFAAGQFPLQLPDARRLLFHDLLELDNALAQVAFGNRTLRRSLSWGRRIQGNLQHTTDPEDTDEPENPLRYFFICSNYCRGD